MGIRHREKPKHLHISVGELIATRSFIGIVYCFCQTTLFYNSFGLKCATIIVRTQLRFGCGRLSSIFKGTHEVNEASVRYESSSCTAVGPTATATCALPGGSNVQLYYCS